MGRGTTNVLLVGGAIAVLLGLGGFAMPEVTTHQTKELARIGDTKLQTTESTSHVIPPVVSGGALVLGVVLVGAGFYQRR